MSVKQTFLKVEIHFHILLTVDLSVYNILLMWFLTVIKSASLAAYRHVIRSWQGKKEKPRADKVDTRAFNKEKLLSQETGSKGNPFL